MPMETTVVVHVPDRRIDTFGTTNFEYCLITELMDQVNQVRVREGRIEAGRPKILQPENMADILFDQMGDHAEQVLELMRSRGLEIKGAEYGFKIANQNMTESIVHDSMQEVSDRIVGEVISSGNPAKAVIQGVDDTWDISLNKFTMEMISQSWEINEFDFKRRGLL